jgi:hypothetical protein
VQLTGACSLGSDQINLSQTTKVCQLSILLDKYKLKPNPVNTNKVAGEQRLESSSAYQVGLKIAKKCNTVKASNTKLDIQSVATYIKGVR